MNNDNIEAYETQQAQIELFAKLSQAEIEIASGAASAYFLEFAEKLRADVHGRV